MNNGDQAPSEATKTKKDNHALRVIGTSCFIRTKNASLQPSNFLIKHCDTQAVSTTFLSMSEGESHVTFWLDEVAVFRMECPPGVSVGSRCRVHCGMSLKRHDSNWGWGGICPTKKCVSNPQKRKLMACAHCSSFCVLQATKQQTHQDTNTTALRRTPATCFESCAWQAQRDLTPV